MDTLQSYERLSAFYQQRATDIESTETSDAIQSVYENAKHQASFNFIVQDYLAKSEIYAAMAEPVFWQNFFNELADSQIDLGDFYQEQALFHQGIKVDSAELMEDARNLIDQEALGFDGTVLNDHYTWDAIGNLTQRHHGAVDLTQTFTYDGLNRLTNTQLSGTGAEFYEIVNLTSQTIEYDSLGNITFKSDVGSYSYDSSDFDHAMPHAVKSISGTKNAQYQYDANGNMISGDGRTIEYDFNNQATRITKEGMTSEFTYIPKNALYSHLLY